MDRKEHDIHAEIVERCLQGDNSACHELYRLYSRAMYNTALRLVRDRDDAQDVLQESFISAFTHLASFRGTSTFGAWLKRIVINKSISQLQKNRPEMLDEGHDVPDDEADPFHEHEYALSVEDVKRGMAQLPDGYRAVLSLYLMEGYDHQEISEILDISVGTSKSQYNRAKRKLRDILNIAHYE